MQKKLIIFIPSIEGGGVEKNLFIISNYLKDKINNISVISVSNKFKNKFNHKIKFVSPKADFWDSIGRRKKFFVGLFLLFLDAPLSLVPGRGGVQAGLRPDRVLLRRGHAQEFEKRKS